VMWVPWEILLQGGALVFALGLVFGLPTGFWYHVALRRELLRVGGLPARWWLHPVRHHGRLETESLGRVTPWFVAGGLGFGVILLGMLGILLGVLATWVEASSGAL